MRCFTQLSYCQTTEGIQRFRDAYFTKYVISLPSWQPGLVLPGSPAVAVTWIEQVPFRFSGGRSYRLSYAASETQARTSKTGYHAAVPRLVGTRGNLNGRYGIEPSPPNAPSRIRHEEVSPRNLEFLIRFCRAGTEGLESPTSGFGDRRSAN
jgi:hypothetical protein